MIKPGEEWGTPTDAAADVEVSGDDAALAAFVAPGTAPPLIRFDPHGSELARAVGMRPNHLHLETRSAAGIELPIDAIQTDVGVAVNAVVLGVSPARLTARHRRRPVAVTVDGRSLFVGDATTVVIANGQFIDGLDVVPRGHPGDGRLEIQVYALNPTERRPMHRRLAAGDHLPHPRIVCTAGRSVEVTGHHRTWSLTLDGTRVDPVIALRVTVVPGAIRLLI